jgi:opacity protein-like surface antigen
MKKSILIASIMLAAAVAQAQQNRFTLSGGYVFSNLEETDISASGFRINALYELLTPGEKLAHGFSVGYMGTEAEGSLVKYKISSWPVYYAPKFMFGEKSLKGFVKGAIGWQFSNIDREGSAVRPSDKDNGFYTGISVGGMKDINEKISINLEYEWAFMYNGFYRDGLINSIMVGVGYSF